MSSEQLTADELAELARVFPPGPSAMVFLIQLGFPRQHVPAALGLDSHDYWSLISLELANGRVTDGRRLILEAAAERYPANPVFRAAMSPAVRSVLFVGTSPQKLAPVRADRELKEIMRAVQGGQIDVHYRPAAAASDLAEIWSVRPDVLHLACHGSDSRLIFEGPGGTTHGVTVADVTNALRVFTTAAGATLEGIVVAACRGAAAAEAFRPFARAIIAHRGDLDDQCAVAFSGYFYRAVRQTSSLLAAAQVAAEQTTLEDGECRALRDGLVLLDGQPPAAEP